MIKTKISASLFAAVVTIASLVVPGSASAQFNTYTQSGPNSAFAWKRDAVPTTETTFVTATITTGVSNRMLVIHGSILDSDFGGCCEQLFTIRPTVNGQRVQIPPSAAWLREPPSGQGVSAPVGSASATWFVDLDAAGLTNVPLTIRLVAAAYFAGTVADVSFSAYTAAK